MELSDFTYNGKYSQEEFKDALERNSTLKRNLSRYLGQPLYRAFDDGVRELTDEEKQISAIKMVDNSIKKIKELDAEIIKRHDSEHTYSIGDIIVLRNGADVKFLKYISKTDKNVHGTWSSNEKVLGFQKIEAEEKEITHGYRGLTDYAVVPGTAVRLHGYFEVDMTGDLESSLKAVLPEGTEIYKYNGAPVMIGTEDSTD